MAPSGHSSSSHSSHSSHSSSHSSHSSHSSSSRSYSSSRSSSSSYSRGPSSHSSTSRTSRPGGTYNSHSYGTVSPSPSRPRRNQPQGYRPSGQYGQQAHYVYGRRHDYVYYPVAWIDSSTGVSYEKGYYDENGTRYDDVSFQKNGTYENVLCHCPYCGQDSVMNLNAKDVGVKALNCPNCGATMEIRSELDDAAPLGGYSSTQGTRSYSNSTSGGYYTRMPRKRKSGCLIAILAVVAVLFILSKIADRLPSNTIPFETIPQTENYSSYVDYNQYDTLYLIRSGGNSYRVTDSRSSADKALDWDYDADSFYDPEIECWVWYNTDVEPPVWQYWVEGISSDYGDYGWMEHDDTGWYIERSYGDWISLPSRYSTDGLWYIR